MGFDFFKKLFSGENSLDSLQESIEKKLNDVTNRFEDKKEHPVDEEKEIHQVEMGGCLYRVKGFSSIEISKNNGKKWELYTELPIYCNSIKVSDDNKLMVFGYRDYKGLKEDLKDSWAVAKEDFVTQATRDKDEKEFWQTRDRWYKLSDKGTISVAKNPNEPNRFSSLETEDEIMVINEEECHIRVYAMCPRDTFYSHDGVKWEYLGELPKDFKEFSRKNGTVFAIDVEENKYAYFGGWSRVEYEAELEVFEDDELYEDTEQIYYEYKDDGKTLISKRIHLLFLKGEIGKLGADIVYISAEGKLLTHSSLPGMMEKLPKAVESHFGDVIITMPNDKRYLYYDGKWRETGTWEAGCGAFCFKAKIEVKDSFWDKVDTFVEEDEKENPLRRSIYYKIPKGDLKSVYYSSDGKEWHKHSTLPEEFKALTSTDYDCHAMAIGTIVYTKKKHHYHWVLKKKGLISKTYYNEWEKFDEGGLLVKANV